MKAVVIFFLGLVAMQQVDALQPEASDLKDQIIILVNNLTELVDDNMDKVVTIVFDATVEIHVLMDDGIDLTNSSIDAILDLINDQEKKALDLGVDITFCVADQRILVEELREKTIANLETTAGRIVDGLDKILREAFRNIASYRGIEYDIIEDLEACSISNLTCLEKVATKANDALSEAYAEIPPLAISVSKITRESVTAGTVDMTKITADLTATTVRITNEITSCVAELMPIK